MNRRERALASARRVGPPPVSLLAGGRLGDDVKAYAQDAAGGAAAAYCAGQGAALAAGLCAEGASIATGILYDGVVGSFEALTAGQPPCNTVPLCAVTAPENAVLVSPNAVAIHAALAPYEPALAPLPFSLGDGNNFFAAMLSYAYIVDGINTFANLAPPDQVLAKFYIDPSVHTAVDAWVNSLALPDSFLDAPHPDFYAGTARQAFQSAGYLAGGSHIGSVPGMVSSLASGLGLVKPRSTAWGVKPSGSMSTSAEASSGSDSGSAKGGSVWAAIFGWGIAGAALWTAYRMYEKKPIVPASLRRAFRIRSVT